MKIKRNEATLIMIFLLSNGPKPDQLYCLRQEIEEKYSVTWEERILGNRKIIFLLISAKEQRNVEQECRPVLGLPNNRVTREQLPQIWDLIEILDDTLRKVVNNLQERRVDPETEEMCRSAFERGILDQFVKKMPTFMTA